MLYEFTNRRRAKDAITVFTDKYGESNLMIFVREGLIYVDIGNTIFDIEISQDITTIMHYAVDGGNMENIFSLDEITELYKGIGIAKFRM